MSFYNLRKVLTCSSLQLNWGKNTKGTYDLKKDEIVKGMDHTLLDLIIVSLLLPPRPLRIQHPSDGKKLERYRKVEEPSFALRVPKI